MTNQLGKSLVLLLAVIAMTGCGPIAEEEPTSTLLSDDIQTDTTLQSDVVYTVTDEIDVEAELVIEPGTRIEFENNTRLQIVSEGSLIADGTDDELITLTGTQQSPGWWDGLAIRSSEHPNNVVDHLVVEYAGASSPSGTDPANIVVGRSHRSAAIDITHTTSRHSDGYGLYLHGNSDLGEFSGNTLTDNEDGAARTDAHLVDRFDASSTYAGNQEDIFRVDSATVSGDDRTWANLDVPYLFSGETSVEGPLVTIDAGAELHFDNDARLQFTDGGGLEAAGTDDDPILFTGIQESTGWWEGIFFRDSEHPDNLIEHAIIEYAGGNSVSGTDPANIIVGRSNRNAEVTITNITSRHSDGYGLYLHGASDLGEFSDNTLTDNEEGAARTDAHLVDRFDASSTYAGNQQDIVRVDSATVSGDDRTWANLDVPYLFSGETSVEGPLVTIDAGAVLHFDNDARLQFTDGGGLEAIGTDQDPILFSPVQETPGWWEGIFFRDSEHPNNRLEHTVVEYAGGNSVSGTDPANIIVGRSHRSADVTIVDNTITNSEGYGVYLHSASEVNDDVCDVNNFSDNADGDCGGAL